MPALSLMSMKHIESKGFLWAECYWTWFERGENLYAGTYCRNYWNSIDIAGELSCLKKGYKDLSCNIKCDCCKTCPDRVGGSFFFQTFFFSPSFGRWWGRGNQPWQISHIKLYDEVLTNRNISDVCVYTARPVKHFRSLVLKICSDIDGLYTNKECNECTLTCSPKPLWVARYQNQNPKSPFGSLTYVLGAFSLHSIDWITKWIADARLSFPHWLWQWLHPRGNRCVLMENTTYFNWVA